MLAHSHDSKQTAICVGSQKSIKIISNCQLVKVSRHQSKSLYLPKAKSHWTTKLFTTGGGGVQRKICDSSNSYASPTFNSPIDERIQIIQPGKLRLKWIITAATTGHLTHRYAKGLRGGGGRDRHPAHGMPKIGNRVELRLLPNPQYTQRSLFQRRRKSTLRSRPRLLVES